MIEDNITLADFCDDLKAQNKQLAEAIIRLLKSCNDGNAMHQHAPAITLAKSLVGGES